MDICIMAANYLLSPALALHSDSNSMEALSHMVKMPSLKASAAAISRTQFVKIPCIGPPLKARMNKQNVYENWLSGLLKVPQNKKTFLGCEKDIVDQCFRLQATQQFAPGSESLERALAEVRPNVRRADRRAC